MSKKEINEINIIYHDENFGSFSSDIIKDYHFIKTKTNGALILTKNSDELQLLLNCISKTLPNCKSVLIMNGGSSEKIISLIKEKGYMRLLIKGIIYCQNVQKYQKIMDKNKNFIENICTDVDSIVILIKNIFKQIKNNKKFECNTIINMYSYTDFYCLFHYNIAIFFDKSQLINHSKFNPLNIMGIDNNKIIFFNKIYNFYESFKNYNSNEFIFNYLKDENLSIFLNQLLIKNEKIDFDYIGYFVGNLMHRIVEYGKTERKEVKKVSQFYKGIQLDIINLFEFIINEKSLISFSHFMMITSKKELAILNSRRNQALLGRENKNIFSVILNIRYAYTDFEPSIFDLSELIPYPDEEEFIVLPFTFFKVINIKIDSKNMNVDIYLDVIGKTEILENKIKEGKKIIYDKNSDIMVAL